MDTVPFIPLALIEWLDKMFPERTPGPDAPLDQIRVETGKREVVRFLKVKYEEQVEVEMNPT